MDRISFALIDKALAGLTERYNFTAENIANANTPGYQPMRVRFEDALRQAASQGVGAINAVKPEAIRDTETLATGGTRLDLELATASETGLRYRALVDVLNQLFALDRADNGRS